MFFQSLLKAGQQSCRGVLKPSNKSPFLLKLGLDGFCYLQSRGLNTAGISLLLLQEYKAGARQTNLLNEGKLAPDFGFLMSAKGTAVLYKYSTHKMCNSAPGNLN